MKILKVNNSQLNAYKSIETSMENKIEISICNTLDACSCTGNGFC